MGKNYKPRWNIMPKYNPFKWDGYSILPRPMGWRRFFHYPPNVWEAPYFAGDRIKLRLNIYQKQENTLPFFLQIYEFFPEYKSQPMLAYDDIVKNIGFKKIREINIISGDNIAITGDGYYQIIVSSEKLPNLNKPFPEIVEVIGLKQTIMTFHAYPSARVFFVICSFLLLLIGGVISWFIKSWLTPI